MNSKYFKPLVLAVSLMIICIATAVSYAYFTASVSGNGSANNNVVVTGHMEVTYEDGSLIGNNSNLLPGSSITKSFNVRNTGNIDTVYNIYLNNVYNDFNPASDLVCEIISEDGRSVSESVCPTTYGVIASNILLGVGETHHYTLKITFKETNVNQDSNKGKAFSSKIELLESNGDYEIVDNYYNDGGSSSDPQELLNSTNKNYMIYTKMIKDYTTSTERYGKYHYGSSSLSEESCIVDLEYEYDPFGKNKCILNDDEWVSVLYTDSYASMQGCENSKQSDDESCELIDTYSEAQRMVKSERIIYNRICAFNNNELVCLDKDKYIYDQSISLYENPDDVDIQHIDMFYNELTSKGYICEKDEFAVECLGDQSSMMKYEPGLTLGAYNFKYKAETRYLQIENPYNSLEECSEINDEYYCIEYNNMYYKWSYGNNFFGINADCSNFVSSDIHYACFPYYDKDVDFEYCEFGHYNRCGSFQPPK